jgi:hypothetical protein
VANPREHRHTSLRASRETLIDRAIETYQPRTSRELTREDGREIIHNLAGFLAVLAEWKKRELAQKGTGK